MSRLALLIVLATLLGAPIATAGSAAVDSDPCDDDDPDTGCSPLGDLIPRVSTNPKDWAACFELDDQPRLSHPDGAR